ncbi:MAG: MarR family transcriptional regulator [Vallitalea sp.]|jgi:DNA-binding MarR family transcriptional regulator|nr:MarR family transcriptional regulator [Vallitalea sp.]
MQDKYIIYFISKTKKRMTKFLEKKLNEYDLGDLIPSHGNILTVLYENNNKLTMKEIANKVGKDKSTITSLINKLIKLGYVTKETNPKDKRVSFIILTDKGKSIESKYNKICDEVSLTAYNGFSDEEKEVFLKLLKKLSTNFKS